VALGAISLPDNSGMVIPAHVQINVKADEYVAVFGLLQEGRTIQDCDQKLNAGGAVLLVPADKISVR
jgi:hypothetical protein